MTRKRPTVVLTGATGNIGSKLRACLADTYNLICVDMNDKGDPEVIPADLSLDGVWMELFRGAEAVIHLAANPDPVQSWESTQRNILIDYLVLEAARRAGVSRLIYGSSNHVMGGYKDSAESITPDLAPRPGAHWDYYGRPSWSIDYGLGKFCGEEMCRCFAHAHGLTTIAVRIGWVQSGENRPVDMPDNADQWTRLMWLSNSDLCELFRRCLAMELEAGTFLVVNGMSKNSGMRWDIESTRAKLGYRPAEGV